MIRKVGFSSIVHTILSIPAWAILSSVVLSLASQVFSSARWRLFVETRPGVGQLFSLYLVGTLFNTVLPGMVGGDAVRAYYLHKSRVSLSESIASIFFERYLGYSILMLFGLLAYPFSLGKMGHTVLAWIFPLIAAGFLLASYVLFRLRLGARIKATASFFHILERYVQDGRAISRGLLYSVVVQTLVILSVWILGWGLGYHIAPVLFFAFMPIIILVSTLPISISGLGVREFSFVILFGSVGLGPQEATSLSLAWFVSLIIAGMVGLIEFLRLRIR